MEIWMVSEILSLIWARGVGHTPRRTHGRHHRYHKMRFIMGGAGGGEGTIWNSFAKLHIHFYHIFKFQKQAVQLLLRTRPGKIWADFGMPPRDPLSPPFWIFKPSCKISYPYLSYIQNNPSSRYWVQNLGGKKKKKKKKKKKERSKNNKSPSHLTPFPLLPTTLRLWGLKC